MKAILLLVAALAGLARAHKFIAFEVRGPAGVQFTVSSEDGGASTARTGTIPSGGSVNWSVEGYMGGHDGTERISAVFDDGMGPVNCTPVSVNMYEPSYHFAVSCKPTFTFNPAGRSCTSSCPVGPPPDVQRTSKPRAFPNPWRHAAEPIQFVNLPANARVRIFDMSGRLVFQGTSGGEGGFHWHCRDNGGRHVSSGVYVVVADSPGKTATLKVAVQH